MHPVEDRITPISLAHVTMNTPVQAPTGPVAQQTDIDRNQVEFALRDIRADAVLRESALADALRNPNLNEAERNEIIQTLAREDGQQIRFFGNDATRFTDNDYAALSADQQVIADAVQNAYEDGALNADDLVRIADANGAGNGAQRFISILKQSSTARQPGGVAEVLADALWTRNGNDGLDRAGAAIVYSSDPTMMSRNLDTPEKRAEAFEALVNFNEKAPYNEINAGPTGNIWEASALSAAGRLFTAHSQELIDHYTSAQPGQPGQTEVLSKFMSQTVFNPDAQGIMLDRSRDLVPAIRDALSDGARTFLERASAEGVSATDQSRAMRQFGQLTASISGGAAVALTRYDEQINATKESREQFAGLVGDLVGQLPLGDLAGTIADKVTEPIANQIAEALIKNPDRPDAALAGVIYDDFSAQADRLSEKVGNPDLIQAFESGYSSELLNLQQNLNVNLGGHAN